MTIQQAFRNVSLDWTPRDCQHPQDFGDVSTIGKQLKTLTDPERFGVFMGNQDGTYIVAVYQDWSFNLTTVEEFPTLAALKQVWILD